MVGRLVWRLHLVVVAVYCLDDSRKERERAFGDQPIRRRERFNSAMPPLETSRYPLLEADVAGIRGLLSIGCIVHIGLRGTYRRESELVFYYLSNPLFDTFYHNG